MELNQYTALLAQTLNSLIDWKLPTPPEEMEMAFNGGVAEAVSVHYSSLLMSEALDESAQILEMGCGYGRIALGLTRWLGPGQRYIGIDPNAEGIAWAQSNITPYFPDFTFERVDIQSRPYNPRGVLSGRDFRFPFDEESLDLVFMISVLTHVDFATLENYLREAARTLKSEGGRLVVTAFLLDDDVDRLLAAGQGHFKMAARYGVSRVENPKNPELAVGHPKREVLALLSELGFEEAQVREGFWSGRRGASPMDFQDLVIARRSPSNGGRAESPHPAWPLPIATQPQLEQLWAQLDLHEDQVGEFVVWCNSLTLNAYRWRWQGLELFSQHPGRESDALDLRFSAYEDLNISALWPAESQLRYEPISESQAIELLRGAGRPQGRTPLVALQKLVLEILENGLSTLQARSSGRQIVLKERDSQIFCLAPIPEFPV